MNLLEECAADCPYCGEPITLLIDASESEQSYVEDCEVCCRPMVVSVQVDDEGEVALLVGRDDD